MHNEQFLLHADIESSHWWFLGRRKIVNGIVDTFLNADPAKKIIDIGCGTGGNIADLSERYNTVGIDPNHVAIEQAKKRFPKTKFVCGLAPGDIQEDLREADIILLTDVIEHIEDDSAFLRSIFPFLKEKALVLITVPATPSLWSKHDESFGHYRRYTSETLTALLRVFPFKVRLLSYFNTRLFPVIWLMRRFNNLFNRSAGSVGTDFTMLPFFLNKLLSQIFAGELVRIISQVDSDTSKPHPYKYGVSMITVVEKL